MRDFSLVKRPQGGYWIYSSSNKQIGYVEKAHENLWVVNSVLGLGVGEAGTTPEEAVLNELQKASQYAIVHTPPKESGVFQCKYGTFHFEDVIGYSREEWDGEKFFHFRVKKLNSFFTGDEIKHETELTLDKHEYESYMQQWRNWRRNNSLKSS